MLTIDEIKNVTFRNAKKNGYLDEDVDSFIDEVIESFEQLKKEKTNLVHKIDVLATRVEQYRADEETVRNALLASQKVADACIREAKEKAAKIVREAEAKAQTLLVEANKTTAVEKDNYLQLQADAVALRTELIELYKKHISAINDLPTSAELDAVRAELDEKYPVEESVQTDNVQEQPEVETIVQAAEEPIDETAANEAETVVESVIQKKPSKFAHLKFGDNYDVSAD